MLPVRSFNSIMKNLSAFVFIAWSSIAALAAQRTPLRLYPENPHYFLWRGKPTVLIGSGEHYGAVLNLDFDYAAYLKELESQKLNLTRTFTGAYVEPPGTFHIASNTLAPAPERLWRHYSRSRSTGLMLPSV